METTPDKIDNLIDISRRPISLETPIEEDADSEFGDFIEDKSSPQPAEVVTHNLLREHLEQVLARLPDREAHILELRYGLLDGETHTLEEVGQKIGVTRERVRQLEAQALNRLRHSSAHQLLQDYLLDI
jgi:RNA polymerase primary sigma factor